MMTAKEAKKIALLLASSTISAKSIHGRYRGDLKLEYGLAETDQICKALVEISRSLKRQSDWIQL